MIKDIKLDSIDKSEVNPDDEKFIKLIFNKDNRVEIIIENLSPNQVMVAAKSLAQAAAKLWSDGNE